MLFQHSIEESLREFKINKNIAEYSVSRPESIRIVAEDKPGMSPLKRAKRTEPYWKATRLHYAGVRSVSIRFLVK
jgi:hypothetical protein